MKKTIGLVLIDTSAPTLAANAIRISMEQFKFDSVTVFSDEPNAYPGLRCIEIEKMHSALDYSNFVIRKLPEFIVDDFILIIHYDGFILNGNEFSPHFFHYDYIGAPWLSDQDFPVGNGGFSWRSKKLCDAIKALANGESLTEPEDVYICKVHRKNLEKNYGIFFADASIALHFSYEHEAPRFSTFGFHGAFHLPYLYNRTLAWLVDHLPDRMMVAEDITTQVFKYHLGLVSSDAAKLHESAMLARGEAAALNRSILK